MARFDADADAELRTDAGLEPDAEFDAAFDPYEHGFADDRAFSAWHLTAGLGAVATLATVGIVWWATATVSGWHLPSPSAEQALALEPEPAAAAAAASDPTTTVVAKSDRAPATRSDPMELRLSGWEADLDRTARPFVLPDDFAVDQIKPWPSQPASETRAVPSEANAAPPVADRAPETDAPVAESPVNVAHRTFAPRRRLASAERDQPRERDQHRATSPKLHNGFARGSYTEKVVEQGDAGEVKYRYVRHACTPPHMVDVCYMPAESRRSVVVQRY
jgi:hypothetical protein